MAQLFDIYPYSTNIPLVVALWQGQNYHGIVCVVLEDVPDLSDFDFNQKTSAIGVHPGPYFQEFTSFRPTVTFTSSHDSDGQLTLETGAYSDLSIFGWAGRIKSVKFNYGAPVAAGIYRPRQPVQSLRDWGASAKSISSLPLIIDAWTNWEWDTSRPPGQQVILTEGSRVTMIDSSTNLRSTYGPTFDGSLKLVRVRQGPTYTGYEVVRLHRSTDYGEIVQTGYVEFGPTNTIEFVASGDTLPVKSVQFTQPPIHPPIHYTGPFFMDASAEGEVPAESLENVTVTRADAQKSSTRTRRSTGKS
jgi:hypothetical protein